MSERMSDEQFEAMFHRANRNLEPGAVFDLRTEARRARASEEAWRSEANRLREELEGQRAENEAMAQRLKEHREDFRSQRARFDEELRELRYELSVAREKDGGK